MKLSKQGIIPSLFLIVVMLLGGMSNPAFAGDNDPLFVNITTDDAYRAGMGISFGKAMMGKGHPLTILLNDKGVFVASTAKSKKYAENQKMLSELAEKGATILACPACLKHYKVKETDLLTGVKVGSPDSIGGALFKDNTKTMTW